MPITGPITGAAASSGIDPNAGAGTGGTGSPQGTVTAAQPVIPTALATAAKPLGSANAAVSVSQFPPLGTGLKGTKITAAPKKSTKRTPGKGKEPVESGGMIATPKTKRTVSVTTRTAVLRFIASMAQPPSSTVSSSSRVAGASRANVSTSVHEGGSTVVTETVRSIINTIGSHVLNQKGFTIEYLQTPQQWQEIRQQASARVDEREKQEAVVEAQKKAGGSAATGSASATAIYETLISTYAAASGDKTKKTIEGLNDQLVNMGLIDTHTPTPEQVGQAYQEIIKKAQSGDETAAQAIAKQVTANAGAVAGSATMTTAESIAAYFREEYTALATDYQVPISNTTLNTMAANSALRGGTSYQSKQDQIAAFTTYVKRQAMGLYPTLAPQIDKGFSVKTLVDPYAQVAASVLGYGSSATYSGGASASTSQVANAEGALGVTWSNPKWSVALQGGKAETGKAPAPMTLDTWRKMLITTPQYGWQKTSAAANLGQNAADRLAEDFGFIKA